MTRKPLQLEQRGGATLQKYGLGIVECSSWREWSRREASVEREAGAGDMHMPASR